MKGSVQVYKLSEKCIVPRRLSDHVVGKTQCLAPYLLNVIKNKIRNKYNCMTA